MTEQSSRRIQSCSEDSVQTHPVKLLVRAEWALDRLRNGQIAKRKEKGDGSRVE